ncbi:Cytochrome c heme lyase subunit CcmH [Lysobacter dokdonensis DS-58]|uniref:Cytochrome c heme lyase subunit CcmH n=1 Tax=Lysobacter dokdonensis DS-58 TaxID=1300345 RepID=A0A0A2X531_9GAMM|nr:tetratricopeptide repeat protein [Lysobacter dokdonensis]KGQ20379.1 Cytochrome c heme lyase subunit CcmH [Lysobacter dokdonensis DS-58]
MSPTLQFAIAGAVLVLIVVAVLVRPLWRDSQRLVFGIAVCVSLSAVALYRIVGTPAALDAKANVAMPETLDDAIKELQSQLAKNPDNAEGWRLLGQVLGNNQRFAESRDAFAHAVNLTPKDPDLLVEAAQARALADKDRRFDITAVTMLRDAIQVQPQHQRARWFLGIAQRQQGQDAEAAKTWEPLLAMVDASTQSSLRAQINEARVAAGMQPLPEPATPATPNALRVRVALDADLAARARLRGDATVFVIARAAGGPPMPVAVERHTLADLPLDITLDDGDSPMPTAKLSALKDVEVIARISTSGNAIGAAGDLESAPVQVKLPADKPVDLTIGTVRE